MSTWQQAQRLDRAEHLRGDDVWLAQAWNSPRAQVITASGNGQISIRDDALARSLPQGAYRADQHYFLGMLEDDPVFAIHDEQAATGLRGALGLLSDAERELAFAASGLVSWHSRAGHCGRCGQPTSVTQAGNARVCPTCELEDYPRTDPAVIVAVTNADGDLLLGRHPSWPATRYSVLAGFVEVGESLEQTVCREIGEEVGLVVGDVTYLGSQPWPFPRSLMIAFSAVARAGEIVPDPQEIETARWFSREQLTEAIADGSLSLPGEASISYRMIQAWIAGDLQHSNVG